MLSSVLVYCILCYFTLISVNIISFLLHHYAIFSIAFYCIISRSLVIKKNAQVTAFAIMFYGKAVTCKNDSGSYFIRTTRSSSANSIIVLHAIFCR